MPANRCSNLRIFRIKTIDSLKDVVNIGDSNLHDILLSKIMPSLLKNNSGISNSNSEFHGAYSIKVNSIAMLLCISLLMV